MSLAPWPDRRSAPWYDGLHSYVDDAPARMGHFEGDGSPEGVLAAGVGSTYRRLNGGSGTSLYVKEGGGSTAYGWIAK